nr:MAG TPA: hypothetical protein [Caudoviricetes sp.]
MKTAGGCGVVRFWSFYFLYCCRVYLLWLLC